MKQTSSSHLAAFLIIALAFITAWGQEPNADTKTDLVGRSRKEFIVTPVNQLLTPFGRLLELPGLRP